MAAEEEIPAEDSPQVAIKFLFGMCNDIDKVRAFYTDLLGMEETSYMNDESWGWLVYKCEGFEFMWFRGQGDETIPPLEDFTWQPGCGGGPLQGVSWAINIPWDSFADTVQRLKDAGVKSLMEDPEWRQESYWGFSVMDPMGYTIEVYSTPPEKPENTEWPD